MRSERRLKNYNKYLRRLKKLLTVLNLQLEISRNIPDEPGLYIPAKRKIYINLNLRQSEKIAVILHEIGHHFDSGIIRDSKYYRSLNRAYAASYKGTSSDRQDSMVFSSELRAWKYGIGIGKNLGIKLGKWFDKIQNKMLKTYEG